MAALLNLLLSVPGHADVSLRLLPNQFFRRLGQASPSLGSIQAGVPVVDQIGLNFLGQKDDFKRQGELYRPAGLPPAQG